jgi:uncharacterized membrane protein YdbT with pleckstrin-like domain
MKKCPFCAEEIQEEAIKCKHCGSMLNEPMTLAAPAGPAVPSHPDEEKKLVYEGSPSWRAYFGSYFLLFLLVPLVAAAAEWAAVYYKLSDLYRALAILIPLAVGLLGFLIISLVRKANRVRMTNRSVESESGVFSKKIDVMELWRIRDVRYRQSFLDRILGIAHIDVFTKDVTSPYLEIVGLPASRQLFEQLRDNIEIQRQSKRVMGLIE